MQLVGEHEGREQENILGPLMDADRLEQGARQWPPVEKDPGDRNPPHPQRNAQAKGGIGQPWPARALANSGRSARELPM